MKNLIIELHELVPYAVNAANSGEFGEVKHATIGGISRVIMSSQSLKYAIRTVMAQNNLRTNYYVNEIINRCFEIDSDLATDAKFVKQVLDSFNIALKTDEKKNKKDVATDNNIEKLMNGVGLKSKTTEVTSRSEINDIAKVLIDAYRSGCDKVETQKRLNEMDRFVDLWTAAFGRMSTNSLFDNIEGAVQTSMSYSVDAFLHQTDYFSVVDSLKQKYEPYVSGAANNQDRSISSNTMYRYMSISVETLARNYRILERLGAGNVYEDSAAKEFANFVAELMIYFTYSHPIAKQHGMASMPTPSAIGIFVGKNIFTCTMDNAFNRVVQASHNSSVVEEAANRMIDWTENDMLVEQYDSAVMWVPAATKDSNTVETRHSMNNAYVYMKNDIVKMVLDYLYQLKEESV